MGMDASGRCFLSPPPFILVASNSHPHTPFPPSYRPLSKRDFVLEAASAAPGADPGDETPRMDALAFAYDASPMKTPTPLAADNRHKSLGGVTGRAASPWVLFKLNLWRCSLQLARDKATLGLWAAVSSLIGVLLGVLYWQQVRALSSCASLRNWKNHDVDGRPPAPSSSIINHTPSNRPPRTGAT